jgi:hypothetical protein
MELLAGMLDSDGWVEGRSGQPRFTVTSEKLAMGFVELVRSLGFKPSLSRKQVKGARESSSTAFTVGFATSEQVFQLPRKGDRLSLAQRSTTTRRYVTSIEPIESVPVACIQVEAEDSLYLCSESFIATHNSAIVQAVVQRGNDHGQLNTALYFSADSDSATMFKRAAAIHSGWTQSDIEAILENGDAKGVEAAVNAATSHIRWSFESSPTEDMILLEIEAYAATFGAFPDILVFDNLKDIQMGVGEGEFQMLEEACVFLKGLARDTNAAVIALHHVQGSLEDGLTPIPLSGLRGKVSKTPAVVLTLHRNQDGSHLNVSPVKVRSGTADASGRWFLPVAIDLSRMSFTG